MENPIKFTISPKQESFFFSSDQTDIVKQVQEQVMPKLIKKKENTTHIVAISIIEINVS